MPRRRIVESASSSSSEEFEIHDDSDSSSSDEEEEDESKESPRRRRRSGRQALAQVKLLSRSPRRSQERLRRSQRGSRVDYEESDSQQEDDDEEEEPSKTPKRTKPSNNKKLETSDSRKGGGDSDDYESLPADESSDEGIAPMKPPTTIKLKRGKSNNKSKQSNIANSKTHKRTTSQNRKRRRKIGDSSESNESYNYQSNESSEEGCSSSEEEEFVPVEEVVTSLRKSSRQRHSISYQERGEHDRDGSGDGDDGEGKIMSPKARAGFLRNKFPQITVKNKGSSVRRSGRNVDSALQHNLFMNAKSTDSKSNSSASPPRNRRRKGGGNDDDESFHLSGSESIDDDELSDEGLAWDDASLYNDDMSFEDEMSSSDNDDDDYAKPRRNQKKTKKKLKSKKKNKSKAAKTRRQKPKKRHFGRLNDESSFDEEESLEKAAPKLPPTTRAMYEHDSDDSDDNSVIISTPTHHRDTRRLTNSPSPLKCIPCTSTVDEITMENLPRMHVCYLAPDGKTRHCFSLETIYRAAIMGDQTERKNDGSEGLTFLQPPHFRTRMEETLADQIASRFGRQALCIEDSKVYRKEQNTLTEQQNYNELFNSDDELINPDDNFRGIFERYLSKQMGTGDVYVCPLCYAEAQRRFRGESETDDYDSDLEHGSYGPDFGIETIVASKVDPMTTLGGLDEDEFMEAASFCFRKVTEVKAHLKKIHNENPSSLFGNDLFKRFMIRAQDGLLQQHLHAYWQKVLVGAMARYWNEGHSQNFILLKDRIDRRQLLETVGGNGEHSFCMSFPHRAKKLWNIISAPYLKEYDASDFIDDDNEVLDSGPRPMLFERPDLTVEEEIIQSLRNKRMSMDSSDEEGKQGDSEDFSLNPDDEMISLQSAGSSQDKWTKKKLSRQSPKQIQMQSNGEDDQMFNHSSTSVVKDTRILEITDQNGDEWDNLNLNAVSTPKKRRAIIIDSDEDE